MKIALTLKRVGLNSDALHGMGFASIVGAVSLWIRSAAVDDIDKKARAERLAIFVGLWPPTFFLLGKVLQISRRRRTNRSLGGMEATRRKWATRFGTRLPAQHVRTERVRAGGTQPPPELPALSAPAMSRAFVLADRLAEAAPQHRAVGEAAVPRAEPPRGGSVAGSSRRRSIPALIAPF